jgi:hypothetical protein
LLLGVVKSGGDPRLDIEVLPPLVGVSLRLVPSRCRFYRRVRGRFPGGLGPVSGCRGVGNRL